MPDNVNTEYEKLTQEIYQTLNSAEGFQTIDIKHNVKIKGKSGCEHQIDVYWEFKNLGETHRVAIECKNYSIPVPIGKIRDFFGVLHDIGDIKGIFVSKFGFQSGAKQFSDYYGISLKEIRFPNEKDWEGRVKEIHVNMSAVTTANVRRRFVLDEDWLKNKYPDMVTLPQIRANTADLIIEDGEGNPITSIYKTDNQLIDLKIHTEKQKGLKKSFPFGSDAYIKTNGYIFKIMAIEYMYDINISEDKLIIDGVSLAKAILKDIKSGNRYFFDKYGHVNRSDADN